MNAEAVALIERLRPLLGESPYAVALALATHADATWTASKSIPELCALTGRSRETVKRAVRALTATDVEGVPLLVRQEERRGRAVARTLYHFNRPGTINLTERGHAILLAAREGRHQAQQGRGQGQRARQRALQMRRTSDQLIGDKPAWYYRLAPDDQAQVDLALTEAAGRRDRAS